MSEQHLCASAGCFHLRGHAGPHSWNRAAVAPPSAPKCNCHICQGVGGKDVAPPETTAPTATKPTEDEELLERVFTFNATSSGIPFPLNGRGWLRCLAAAEDFPARAPVASSATPEPTSWADRWAELYTAARTAIAAKDRCHALAGGDYLDDSLWQEALTEQMQAFDNLRRLTTEPR